MPSEENTETVVLHACPRLAAQEYIRQVYDVPVPPRQALEVERAFAAGMLHASTVFCLALAAKPEDAVKAAGLLDAMQASIARYGLAMAEQLFAEREAFKKQVEGN